MDNFSLGLNTLWFGDKIVLTDGIEVPSAFGSIQINQFIVKIVCVTA